MALRPQYFQNSIDEISKVDQLEYQIDQAMHNLALGLSAGGKLTRDDKQVIVDLEYLTTLTYLETDELVARFHAAGWEIVEIVNTEPSKEHPRGFISIHLVANYHHAQEPFNGHFQSRDAENSQRALQS